MEFDDPELEPTILPVDARMSLAGRTSVLREIFDRLAAVIPTKEKIPGTSLVHIIATEDGVRFTASDGNQTLIIKTTELRVARAGKVMLPGQKVKTIFGLAPNEFSKLTVFASTATVTSGRAVWDLATPTAERMPAIPDLSGIELQAVPRRAFFKALQATKRALPGQGGRRSLEQANVVNGAVTASDGYRLIRQKVEGFPAGLNFTIPRDTVDELLRSLSAGAEEHVFIGAANDLIVVRDGSEILVSRELGLEYTDLEKLLLTPAMENEYLLTVDTNELRDLIKRVRVSADPEYATVTLHFSKQADGEWELTVFTRDRAGNSASETTTAIWEGSVDPFDISLSHRFLSDLLEAYPGRLGTLRVGKNTKTRAAPLLMRDDEKGFVGVVQQSISK